MAQLPNLTAATDCCERAWRVPPNICTAAATFAMIFASVFSTIACSRIASLRDNDRFAWIFLAQSTEAAADRSTRCSFSFACYFRGHGDNNQHINASEFQMILQIALSITQTHIDNRSIQSFGASRGSLSDTAFGHHRSLHYRWQGYPAHS